MVVAFTSLTVTLSPGADLGSFDGGPTSGCCTAREYFEQLGVPQGPPEPEESDPFQETRDAMNLGIETNVACKFTSS